MSKTERIYRCDGGFTVTAGGLGPGGFSKESSRLPVAAHSLIKAYEIPIS
jgi:hypothetical protein